MWWLLIAFTAHADVAPGPFYVERCKVEAYQDASNECITCRGTHEGRAECEALSEQGYEHRCDTRGASVWTEVHCRPRATPADAPPETKAAPGGCVHVGGAWLGAGLLAFLARRSRRDPTSV